MRSNPLSADPPQATVGERALGALLGTFVGDALGMPWEGAPVDSIPAVLEMKGARLGRGTYTDDTQMTIALAESLLRCDGVDEEDLARTFVAHHDPHRGYGVGTTRVLAQLRAGTPVAEAARQAFAGRGSLGNGAAMRVAPVAVRFFEDEVLLDAQARRSARVTHAHDVAIDAAATQAAAVAAALDGREPLEAATRTARTDAMRAALDEAAERTAAGLDPGALAGGDGTVPALAHPSVAAAVVAGARCGRFEEAVEVAVRAGGDTDTVAAMAGAIAGARFGNGAIPPRWLEALEDGERGRSHVEAQAGELAARALAAVAGAPTGRKVR
ncbi:MAG: ADP-ribosylglycohydrolase family protein [Thermoleophilaceae bacterium]